MLILYCIILYCIILCIIFILPCIQNRRHRDAADPAGGWFAVQTNQTPSAPGELHLHSSVPTGNTPAEFCCTRQTESWTGAQAGEDKHTNSVAVLISFSRKWLFTESYKGKGQRATYRLRGAVVLQKRRTMWKECKCFLNDCVQLQKGQSDLLSNWGSSLPHRGRSVTCQSAGPRGTAWPMPLSLTTVGSVKGLALACGKGEPAIAMATDWLIVLPLSGSASSAWAEAWRTRTGEESTKK